MTEMDASTDRLNPFSAQPANSAPLVTGVSPRDGIPGTKVTIRGENLGINSSDITSIKICGIECVSTLNHISDRKLVVRTGRCVGKGDVIIRTRSGGLGSSLVGFTGRFDKVGKFQRALQETAYWIDEDIPTVVGLVSSTVSSGSCIQDVLGMPSTINRRRSLTIMGKTSTVVDMYDESDGCDVTKSDFNPIKYLTQTKSNASLADLKNGLKHLKMTETRDNSSAALVKTNIVAFFDAVDIIQEMRDQIVTKGSTYYIKQAMQKVDDVLRRAHHMYDSDLKRKSDADLIRDCMSVMERFKFLFLLPQKIKKYTEKGEFGRAINDYVRAKSLFDTTDIKILSSAMNEVEKEIQLMMSKLENSLFVFPQSLEDQRDIIRHLESLNREEPTRDLAGECISKEADWIMEQLEVTRGDYDYLAESQDHDNIGKIFEAIDKLSNKLLDFLKELWDISSLYVRGQLSTSSNTLKTEQERLSFVGDVMTRCCNTFVACIRKLVLNEEQTVDVALYGTNLLEKGELLTYRLALLPEIITRYKYTIRGINVLDIPSKGRSALMELLEPHLQSFFGLDNIFAFVLSGSIEIAISFITDLRVQCLSVILLHAAYETANLYKKVDWTVSNVQTYIPDLFVELYRRALRTALRYCFAHDKGYKEKDLLTDRRTNKSCQLLLFGVIAGYFSAFEQITLNVGESHCPRRELVRRCVILYTNLEYTQDTVLPKVEHSIAALGFKDPKRIVKESANLFEDACAKVCQAFVEKVVNAYVDEIQKEMWANGSFDWSDDLPLIGVRSYIYSILNKLSLIEYEIASISDALIKRLISETINAICSKVFTLYSTINRFSPSGSFIAALDATAIYNLFGDWFTDDTRAKFQHHVVAKIPNFVDHSKSEEFDRLIKDFETNVDFVGKAFSCALK
ncbi:hypothetical protein ACOME3_000100 [Neoechinorhynchus agilis]